MKKRTLTTVALVAFTLCALGLISINTTSAQSGDDIMVSFQSNSGWILSKTSRKLMFFRYSDENVVWTTLPMTLPANIDLSDCILDCVGSRGTAVFLYDRTNRMIWFFQAIKDRTIRQYVHVDAAAQVR